VPPGGLTRERSAMRRVVITGTGVVSPVGNTTGDTWDSLMACRSGLGPITAFDASTFPTRIAGEVKDLRFWETWRERRSDYALPDCVSQTTKLAVRAALEAWDAAGIAGARVQPERVGIYLGAGKGEGLGDLEFLGSFLPGCLAKEGQVDLVRFVDEARRRFDPRLETEVEPGRIMVHLAGIFGARGPVSTCLTACAAGAQAVGEALRVIREGEADVMLAGGCHSMITPQSIMGFCLLNALSTDNDRPREASRPFDKTRNGFVLSEGAAVLVLEELAHARARGAPVLGELAGYGCTSDAYRVTDPHPQGTGQANAIRRCLADANASPDEVDYINAHGTSTADNDEAETLAIKQVFGERAYRIPVSSTKSMTGHLIGAAGALEAIVCALAIRNGVVPPTINYREADPACDLDYVPNTPREVRIRSALTNSFGFGGQNTTLLVRAI
jgi:3-oxoacyl-[acyl-carrier-protein] synthase II